MAVEDDLTANKTLAEEFPGVIVAPRFEGPSEAKSYISGLDFFCGSRMHACIAAFSSGVPVLPIAYSRKFAGVFGSLGYDRIADAKTQTTEQIFDPGRSRVRATSRHPDRNRTLDVPGRRPHRCV